MPGSRRNRAASSPAMARAGSQISTTSPSAACPVQSPGRLLDKPVRPDEALRPAIAAADELADRQRVQELVGQQQQRRLGQGLQPVMPAGARARQPFRLDRPQPRRGLDQVHPQRGAKIRRHPAHGAQRVRHQRAPPGPGLGQDHRIRPPQQRPAHRRPGAQNLAEGLADLRRCGEIGERIALGIIGRVGPGHEPVQPFGAKQGWGSAPDPGGLCPAPVRGLSSPQPLGLVCWERGRAEADQRLRRFRPLPQQTKRKGSRERVPLRGGGAAPLLGFGAKPNLASHRTRRTSQMPAITIGTDSSWPIVAPANRKPRNASGWRKNSPVIRASP